jgi:putative transcriptional regulator
MPSHHPDQSFLFDYATGALREPAAILIASHLTLCPACRHEVEMLEALGGAVIETGDTPAKTKQEMNNLLAHLIENLDAEKHGFKPDSRFANGAGTTTKPGDEDSAQLPAPLLAYMPGGMANLRWRSFGSVAEAQLLKRYPGYKLTLCRMPRSMQLPEHTHSGEELILILSGGMHDEHGQYLRGDIIYADTSITHRPIINADKDCLALWLTNAELVHTGPLGWFYNLLRRFTH